MVRFLQLAVFLIGHSLWQLAHACSWSPAGLEEIASSPEIAIGQVTDEDIRESTPEKEYYRSRSVTTQLVKPLKGSIRFPVKSGISCGAGYAPLGSRVIVYMVEPGLYGVVEATPELERRLRKKLGLPANNSFKPKPLRGSA